MTIQVAKASAREREPRGGRKGARATTKMSSPRSPREEDVEEMETEMSPEPNGKLPWPTNVVYVYMYSLV